MIHCVAQLAPSATTQTELFTLSANYGSSNIQCIVICNRGSATTFRISLRLLGDTLSNKQYITYDAPIDANDTICLTYPIGLRSGDSLYVYAGSADLSFSVYV